MAWINQCADTVAVTLCVHDTQNERKCICVFRCCGSIVCGTTGRLCMETGGPTACTTSWKTTQWRSWSCMRTTMGAIPSLSSSGEAHCPRYGLSIRVSVCLSFSLRACLPACLPVCLPACLSVSLFQPSSKHEQQTRSSVSLPSTGQFTESTADVKVA